MACRTSMRRLTRRRRSRWSTRSPPPACRSSRSVRPWVPGGCRRWPTPRRSSVHQRAPGVQYTALVRTSGLRRAIAAGVTEVAVFAAASDTSAGRTSTRGSRSRWRRTRMSRASGTRRAARARVPLHGFGCPYVVPVPVEPVSSTGVRLRDLGAYQVAVSDTIGVAHPGQVWDVIVAMELACCSRTSRSTFTTPGVCAGQCACGTPGRYHDVRCVSRRDWKMAVCAWCGR